MNSLDDTIAADEVGYESVSQFIASTVDFFGQQPIRNIKATRKSNTTEVKIA